MNPHRGAFETSCDMPQNECVGLTVRAHIATAAMAALIQSARYPFEACVPGAVACADALLAELAKKDQNNSMKKTNIERFGRLKDNGGDVKRTLVIDDRGDGWKEIRIEIDTNDCDRDHALAFKKALIELWNSQP